MSTVYLKGGAVIERAHLSAEIWLDARDPLSARHRDVISFHYSPSGFTPHDPSSFKVTVLAREIAAVVEAGR